MNLHFHPVDQAGHASQTYSKSSGYASDPRAENHIGAVTVLLHLLLDHSGTQGNRDTNYHRSGEKPVYALYVERYGYPEGTTSAGCIRSDKGGTVSLATVKPILYIDVDGVIFGLYGEPQMFQLRPGVASFLKWCDERFDCRWLTCWGLERIRTMLGHTYCSDFKRWPEADWRAGDLGKAEGIDFNAPEWFWIEDGIMDEERAELVRRGCLHRYIYVNPIGADELELVRKVLEERLAALGIPTE